MSACLPLQVAQLGLTITAEEEAEMDNPANAIDNPGNGALTQAVELWQHALPRLVGPELHVLKTAVKHQVMLLVEQSKHCRACFAPQRVSLSQVGTSGIGRFALNTCFKRTCC